MLECAKCHEAFPTKIVIEGKERNLCNRKYCLSCSPYGKHNTKRLHTTPRGRTKRKKKCERCGRDYVWGRRKGETARFCASCYTATKRTRAKKRAVEYKGGKCVECGYDRCIRSLDFHHTDPKQKDFSVSNKYFWAWERLKKELDKCVLVCKNCHGEIHDDQFGV